jgi:hypothetical protein
MRLRYMSEIRSLVVMSHNVAVILTSKDRSASMPDDEQCRENPIQTEPREESLKIEQ